MPSTRIETASGWLGDRRRQLLEAVQAALVEGIRIPENDRGIRLVQHDPDDMLMPVGASARRTIIEVTMFSGRSLEAKRRLYAALVRNLAPFGLEPGDIVVTLIEVDQDNWGLRGLPASEIELGFKVDV